MYEPSRLITSFHVAGFQHYDGALVLDQMKAGQSLDLVPEPENPHDPEAIELRFNGTKLGYVPHGENGLVSLLAFYGHADAFEARIQQVDPKRSPWHQVRVGIYVTDKRK